MGLGGPVSSLFLLESTELLGGWIEISWGWKFFFQNLINWELE